MPITAQNAQKLLEKIQALPSDQIAEVEEFVNFLGERARKRKAIVSDKGYLNFPVDDLGPWPEGLSLRREDLYGDDGR